MIVGWARFAVAQPAPRAAVPLEPVAAIVDAFRTHSVVAVTAGHGEARGYAFAQLLIHDPRLIAAINDIVIEEGSARYQDVADRFRARRERADRSAASRVARYHAAGARLRSPVGRILHQAMRAVNASLPSARRVRVLLGDPPIEWEHVHIRRPSTASGLRCAIRFPPI